MSFAPCCPEAYDPIQWWARVTPHRIALVDRERDQRLSYARLAALAEAAARLLRRAGVRPGDRVAALAGSRIELVALFFGCMRSGAALVPLNWRLTPVELRAILHDARAALLFAEPRFRAAAEAAMPDGVWRDLTELAPRRAAIEDAAVEDAAVEDAAAEDAAAEDAAAEDAAIDDAAVGGAVVSLPRVDPEAAALILYTSGSTGRPKGVILPHRQLFYNAVATCTAWELGAADCAPVSTPLFHTGGWNVFATPLWHAGGRVVLLDRFEPATFLRTLADEACTIALTVPTQLVMLLETPEFGMPLPRLRRFMSGGAPCAPALAERVRAAGYRLREGYGLTECGPNCFAISDEEALARAGSVGWPVPFLGVRICDEHGRDTAAGEIGELWLRGPQLFAGYFGDEGRTNAVLSADGWLRTGDLARRDADGAHYICGRRKEMFISGGENVFPGEVEAVLAACAGVAEAAVVGVADALWGEVGHAFVVVATDSAIDERALLRHARARLAGYKVPRRVVFLAELPRLGSGKIDRRALAQLAIPENA